MRELEPVPGHPKEPHKEQGEAGPGPPLPEPAPGATGCRSRRGSCDTPGDGGRGGTRCWDVGAGLCLGWKQGLERAWMEAAKAPRAQGTERAKRVWCFSP